MAPQEPKKHRSAWIYIAVAFVVLIIVACGMSIFAISNSPAIQGAVKQTGATLSELTRVQAKVAQIYGLPVDRVGARMNVSSGSAGKNVTTFVVMLVNTPFNQLSENDQRLKSLEIARLAQREYKLAGSINRYCVQMMSQSQIAMFSSSNSKDYCFEPAEL